MGWVMSGLRACAAVAAIASGCVFEPDLHAPPCVLCATWNTTDDPTRSQLLGSMSAVGDLDGDGRGDVAISTVDGVRIYVGLPTGLSSTPMWTLTSDRDGDGFGTVVTSAGDIDGDGYPDLAVSAPQADNGDGTFGRVEVYAGSASGPSPDPAWSTVSHWPGEAYGEALGSAGDVNGDGYDDLVIGAWTHGNVESYEGAASVHLGSADGLSPTASWAVEGGVAWAVFGRSVGSAGDVDADGYDDIYVAGSCFYNTDGGGRVDVYRGSAAGLSTAPWTTHGNMPAGKCFAFGESVASAGDVDADGTSDLAVGAPLEFTEEASGGVAYVYEGSRAGLATAPAWREHPTSSSTFGTSVAGAGDLDGDGYDDVVVGAPYDSERNVLEGRVWVYRGGPAGVATAPVWTAESGVSYGTLGERVAPAGDVDGDGYADVLAFADGTQNSDGSWGRITLYRGGGPVCFDGPDDDGDGLADTCDLCVGDDASGDEDGDGHCRLAVSQAVADCDDRDEITFPGQVEQCDGIDNNCDGALPGEEADDDGDGVLLCGGDCLDTNPLASPYDEEFCTDQLDNNCDGEVDEDCVAADAPRFVCGTAPSASPVVWLALWWIRRRTSSTTPRRPSSSVTRGA
jgi:hypothetical protein